MVGHSEESVQEGGPPLLYPLVIVAGFITAYTLAGVAFLSHEFYGGSFFVSALISAWILWLGFTASRMLVHDLFDTRTLGITVLTRAERAPHRHRDGAGHRGLAAVGRSDRLAVGSAAGLAALAPGLLLLRGRAALAAVAALADCSSRRASRRPGELAIFAARSFDIPLSLSASYCFSFFRLRVLLARHGSVLPSEHRLAAGDAQHGAGDVARLVGREEHEGRRELGRLPGASERCVLAEFSDLLRPAGGREQRRPDRPRSDRVDPDAFGPSSAPGSGEVAIAALVAA